MSDKFNNSMQGVLFKKLKDKDTSPDYSGQCEIEGKEYWISAWINKSKEQRMFMSLRFRLKEKRSATEPFNDEIPF